jgi:hypothetical protein
MGNPVVRFEIVGKDAAKLGDFHSQLCDWRVTAEGRDASNRLHGLLQAAR